MRSKLEMVEEFNKKIIQLPALAQCENELTGTRVDWFKNCVKEELDEFECAWINCDEVGMLDALIDMTYFILGRVYECGFTQEQWDKGFAAVHDANMTKQKGNKGRGSDDDAVKDAYWVGPEERLRKILEDTRAEHEAKVAAEYDEEMKAIRPTLSESAPASALPKVEHRKAGLYLDLEDGSQFIIPQEDLEVVARMPKCFFEVTKLSIKKSLDYNGVPVPESRAKYFPFGILSYAQMLHTKTERLNNLAVKSFQDNSVPQNESIRDSLCDMINYASFAIDAIDKGEI